MSKSLFPQPTTRLIRESLLSWYLVHKRDLPWRRNKDPYAIWVSEIMLQQTRVAAVLGHYASWMRRFPTAEALASASEDEVIAAWSGLGYYRRARYLHKAAKTVIAEFGGRMPRTAAELRKLPGIGAYTSAAIASIAFDEPVAVVDGNVERILLRLAGAAEAGSSQGRPDERSRIFLNPREIQTFADSLVGPLQPGDHNQAIMELGATVCLPRNPLCLHCPVQTACRTRGEHPTAGREPILKEEIRYGLASRENKGLPEVLLRRRETTATVMPGMWELPQLESSLGGEPPELIVRHAIMRTNYIVQVVRLPAPKVRGASSKHGKQRWIKLTELPSIPLTGLARKIFARLGLLAAG